MVKRMSHHGIVHSADGKKSETMFFESEINGCEAFCFPCVIHVLEQANLSQLN